MQVVVSLDSLYIDYNEEKRGYFFLRPPELSEEQVIEAMTKKLDVKRETVESFLRPLAPFEGTLPTESPDLVVFPILSRKTIAKYPGLLKTANSYFYLASKRRKAEKKWEHRKDRILQTFVGTINRFLGSQFVPDITEGKSEAAKVMDATSFVKGQLVVTDNGEQRVVITISISGETTVSEHVRGERWHVMALPFERKYQVPQKVVPIKCSYAINTSTEVTRTVVTPEGKKTRKTVVGIGIILYVSKRFVDDARKEYETVKRLKEEADSYQKALAAFATQYQQNVAIPIVKPPYGFVVVQHMPQTVVQAHTRPATFEIEWVRERASG